MGMMRILFDKYNTLTYYGQKPEFIDQNVFNAFEKAKQVFGPKNVMIV